MWTHIFLSIKNSSVHAETQFERSHVGKPSEVEIYLVKKLFGVGREVGFFVHGLPILRGVRVACSQRLHSSMGSGLQTPQRREITQQKRATQQQAAPFMAYNIWEIFD